MQKVYRIKELVAMGLGGKSTIWNWVKNGRFPQPLRLNGITIWRGEDVERFLQNPKGVSHE